MQYEKHFNVADDGFNGSYYPCSSKSVKAIIEMFGEAGVQMLETKRLILRRWEDSDSGGVYA